MHARRSGLVVRRIARGPSPARVLWSARPEQRPFALISGRGDRRLSGWSYAGLEPVGSASSFEEARAKMRGWCHHPNVPFPGGAVGYVGYDLGWANQMRPRVPRPDPLDMPPSRLLLYDAVYAKNEQTQEAFLVAQPDGAPRMERLAECLSAVAAPPRGAIERRLEPGVSRRRHLDRIEHALELIGAGEIYQVNLTYPLVGRFGGDPRAAFLRLLASPPTFAAYLGLGDHQSVVSASPECFLDFDAETRALSTYPIKGTRPRHPDPTRDRQLAKALARDEKERAEHLMIVDLLRNDVGRIAEIGSVAVEGLAYVESFPGVHHLTSRILGRVREDASLDIVMRALFPGGSITGAPKLRAMEIIDALEDAPRGVYTGAIGYVTPGGSVRASIAIRTAQIREGEVRFGVGGGIVADSRPDREWEETEIKAAALSAALSA